VTQPRQNEMVSAPTGFRFNVRKNGEVVISRHGRVAATLRGQRAEVFLDEIKDVDAQELMARMTGNYKRGNERMSANHPRNRQT